MAKDNSAENIVVLNNSAGLHVRPARELSDRANQFKSTIYIRENEDENGDQVDAKSIMQLLTLGAPKGTELVVTATGEDAEQAVETISELVEKTWN